MSFGLIVGGYVDFSLVLLLIILAVQMIIRYNLVSAPAFFIVFPKQPTQYL